jgi:dTDP-4-dehydrorhamnose reductase
MKVLITGAGGQVGRELQRVHWPEGVEITAWTHREFDIADRDAVTRKIAQPLDLVVNAAAYTAVDRAESDRAAASRINVEGPALLAKRCAVENIPLIHLSTDYVFDGKKGQPYLEDEATQPLNHYGASKLEGERAVRASIDRHVILRTASVFSEWGVNFVKTMLRLGAERGSLRIVNDQVSSPTAAVDIAHAIVRIAGSIWHRPHRELWGTYHFCGQPPVTWYEFARAIFNAGSRFGAASPELLPIPSDQYAAAAVRPAFSAMDCGKIQRQLGIEAPPWAGRLPAVVSAVVGQQREINES